MSNRSIHIESDGRGTPCLVLKCGGETWRLRMDGTDHGWGGVVLHHSTGAMTWADRDAYATFGRVVTNALLYCHPANLGFVREN